MQNLLVEVRQSLGNNHSDMDNALKLKAGTWENIEQKKQSITIKQLWRLFSLLLKVTFGNTSFSAAQLAAVNSELLYTQQQLNEIGNKETDRVKELAQQAHKSIAAAYAILNKE